MAGAARLAAIVLTLSGFVSTGIAADDKPTPSGDRWAVLVGVDDYAHLNPLNYCGADMRALRDQLLRSGFEASRIVLLHDKAEKAKYRPSKANIETELALVLASAERDDVVLVAFGGHGIYRQGTAYLCPYDGQPDDPATLVSLAKLYDDFQRCPARFKLAIVDACRNDPVRGEGRTAESRASALRFAQSLERAPEGIVILNSCSAGQEAKADDGLKHGVFTHYLLQGWEGAADSDKDKVVTLGELFAYTSRETADYVRLTYSAIQKPKLLGELSPEVLQFGLARLDVRPPLPLPTFNAGEAILNSIGMKLVLIPAGEFMMGSEESNAQLHDAYGIAQEDRVQSWSGFDDERPRHRVRISKPFYLGAYEVTKGQFAKFVTATGYQTEAEKNGKGGWGWNEKEFSQKPEYTWRSWGVNQSDSSPVVNVSHNDALAFCQWLSRDDNRPYRLPTEAEWEYACRSGTTSRYYFGDDPEGLAQVGNVADAAGDARFGWKYAIAADDGWPFTAPVGKYRANAFGLYDMHGNAAEWCADWYGKDYYAQSAADDPAGPGNGSFRVIRGGGWNYAPIFCRSAYRYGGAASDCSYYIGFRVMIAP